MARSFLQVAAAEEVAPPLRVVQIEGLVMLKIIKHCKEFSPALVTGQLLGLDVGSVLEVTNCFPFPIQEEDEEIEADGANYQLEMMRCLREVNVDNNTVGWYQSTMLGCFQTAELIETFLNYQENIRRCVCIIYDPSRSNQGALAFKALKLSDSFMDLYRSNNFTGEKLREKNLSWVDIFEEIPVYGMGLIDKLTLGYCVCWFITLQVKVSNSALISAFMTELEPDTPVTQRDYDRLQLSSSPFLERNMEFLIECMDDLSVEQQKFQFYYRSLTRQQAQQQSWLQKRRDENKARKAAGEEPLPEEDPSNPIFKPIPEPPRLESFLIANRIANYCNQINGCRHCCHYNYYYCCYLLPLLLLLLVVLATIRCYCSFCHCFCCWLLLILLLPLSIVGGGGGGGGDGEDDDDDDDDYYYYYYYYYCSY
ncbi:eukaryotic translation initiation factor 3 subunit H [Citrus sinensis]|nr:eukaryotic translation initiation factor 3 subunit H [Citrus sinensis]